VVRVWGLGLLFNETIRAFQRRMGGARRPTLGALLELQRSLGLREVEVIRGGKMETLAWLRTARGRARASTRVFGWSALRAPVATA